MVSSSYQKERPSFLPTPVHHGIETIPLCTQTDRQLKTLASLVLRVWSVMTSEHIIKYRYVVSDHRVVMVRKGKQVSLEFIEPGSGGSYDQITWYKGTNRSSKDKIVSLAGGKLRYYNDYCSGISPCNTSRKGQLNTTTGELTIYQVESSDVTYYFYNFMGSSHDTGGKYEINLKIPGKQHYFVSNINLY